VADRSSGFLYVGLGVVLPSWYLSRRSAQPASVGRHRWLLLLPLGFLALIFLGGTVVGSGPTWLRMPGPYLVSADNRSVDRYNLATARWMAGSTPSGSRVFTDRVNGLLDEAYGRADVLTHEGGVTDMQAAAQLLLVGPQLDKDASMIARYRVQYLVVDRRLDEGPPGVGEYIEDGEQPIPGKLTPTPTAAALAKFDRYPGVDRVYDDGPDAVYATGGIR
jgi:hypothetical protein